MTTTDFLTGTVKGPGEQPHEYLFITKDNKKTRIGEFVYYRADVGDEKRFGKRTNGHTDGGEKNLARFSVFGGESGV